jgi:hypothetical protein
MVHVPAPVLKTLEQDAGLVRTGASAAAPYSWRSVLKLGSAVLATARDAFAQGFSLAMAITAVLVLGMAAGGRGRAATPGRGRGVGRTIEQGRAAASRQPGRWIAACVVCD